MMQFDGTVASITDYSHAGESVAKVFRVDISGVLGFDFVPGQFVMISA